MNEAAHVLDILHFHKDTRGAEHTGGGKHSPRLLEVYVGCSKTLFKVSPRHQLLANVVGLYRQCTSICQLGTRKQADEANLQLLASSVGATLSRLSLRPHQTKAGCLASTA